MAFSLHNFDICLFTFPYFAFPGVGNSCLCVACNLKPAASATSSYKFKWSEYPAATDSAAATAATGCYKWPQNGTSQVADWSNP